MSPAMKRPREDPATFSAAARARMPARDCSSDVASPAAVSDSNDSAFSPDEQDADAIMEDLDAVTIADHRGEWYSTSLTTTGEWSGAALSGSLRASIGAAPSSHGAPSGGATCAASTAELHATQPARILHASAVTDTDRRPASDTPCDTCKTAPLQNARC